VGKAKAAGTRQLQRKTRYRWCLHLLPQWAKRGPRRGVWMRCQWGSSLAYGPRLGAMSQMNSDVGGRELRGAASAKQVLPMGCMSRTRPNPLKLLSMRRSCLAHIGIVEALMCACWEPEYVLTASHAKMTSMVLGAMTNSRRQKHPLQAQNRQHEALSPWFPSMNLLAPHLCLLSSAL